MTIELITTLIIISIGIFLFVKEYFSIDTTSILIMALFIVTGVLTPEEGFSGFNHPATLTLGCMFVVSAALFRSGLLESVGSLLVRSAKWGPLVTLALFVVMAAAFSAFINDAAVVALLLPIGLRVAAETKTAPSKFLIPLSYAALFGGTCTLIGTSTNLLVSGYAQKHGLEPFSMFEFSMPALWLALAGIVYLLTIGRTLLPSRAATDKGSLSQQLNDYVVDITVAEGSAESGLNLRESKLSKQLHSTVLDITRQSEVLPYVYSGTVLQQGDILRVTVSPDTLNKIRADKDYLVNADKVKDKEEKTDHRKLYEMMVPFGSPLAGKSLRKINFRASYGASVLAVRHREATKWSKLGDITMVEGDLLVVLADEAVVNNLVDQKLLFTLSAHKSHALNLRKAIPALLIAAGVIGAAAFNLTSILISAMVGCLLLITTRVLKPQSAYEAIEWKVIFMMAGVLSMGTAIEKTGGANLIAGFIESGFGAYDPRYALSLVFLVSFLSTNVLSSKATAALMAPIVINLAQAMEVSERPFLVAVMFACSLTFITPVSYPTHTMVYAPGNYRYTDFVKVGLPLNIIIWILASFIIPLYFPF